MKRTVSQGYRVTDGIEYCLERKRIKRLHIYIRPPEGDVLVTAPLSYSDDEIESFIREKASWITKHTKKYRERAEQAKMALCYETGETLYFWGEPYRLIVEEESGRSRGKVVIDPEPVFSVTDSGLCEIRYGKVSSTGAVYKDAESPCGTVRLSMPEGSTTEQRAAIIKRRYKELLDKEAERVLAFWSEQTGLKFLSWHSRYMKTRWGSLSVRDKRVCLNIRLSEKPEICLIYVALHEIAHVKEANHGPAFKAILSEYMPSWREAEKVLKD